MNKLDVQELWGSGALPPVPAPKKIFQIFSANQTDPSLSMDYTSKAPFSSSTRLPPPHVSSQMTQGEESHSQCQLGQGEVKDSSAGDRAFCHAPRSMGSAEGLVHTKRHVWLSSHHARLCVPAECGSDLKRQLDFWTLM